MDERGNFDRVARFYDRLARLVYGKDIVNSQLVFLGRIPPSSRILVLGGGSGWWLSKLLSEKQDCFIEFIEPSARMIDRARRSVSGDPRIRFTKGTHGSLSGSEGFQCVITFFVLDLFSEKDLGGFLRKVKESLEPEAIWLATDFVGEKWWQRTTLSVMYFFFRIAAGLDTRHLPPWESALKQSGMRVEETKTYWRGFIKSTVWRV